LNRRGEALVVLQVRRAARRPITGTRVPVSVTMPSHQVGRILDDPRSLGQCTVATPCWPKTTELLHQERHPGFWFGLPWGHFPIPSYSRVGLHLLVRSSTHISPLWSNYLLAPPPCPSQYFARLLRSSAYCLACEVGFHLPHQAYYTQIGRALASTLLGRRLLRIASCAFKRRHRQRCLQNIEPSKLQHDSVIDTPA
jgi:hypothetical protein